MVIVFGVGEPRRRLGDGREAFGEGEAAEREVFLPKYVGHGAERERETQEDNDQTVFDVLSSGERERDEREREGYVEFGFLCGSWEERERERERSL